MNRFAVQLDAARIGNFQSSQNAQQRGFAATGRSNENETVRFLQSQRYGVERLMRVEAFGKVGNLKFQSEAVFRASASKVKLEGSG